MFASDPWGPFQFLIGLNGYKNTEEYDPINVGSDIGNYFLILYARSRATSFSAFTETELKIGEKITVLGGIRYTTEKRRYNAGFVEGAPLQRIGSATFENWTPRFSLSYEPNSALNVYLSYNSGFKSGLFDTIAVSSVPVEPEKAHSWEMGLKGRISDVTVSLAAFRIKVSNRQVQSIGPNGIPALTNAASTRITGGEGEINWKISPLLDLRAGLSWLPTAKYVEYDNAPIQIPNPNGVGGIDTVVPSLAGARLSRAAKLQGNASATYTNSIGPGEIILTGSLSYSSAYKLDLGNFVRQSAYALLNAQATYSPSTHPLEFSLWARNLTNKATILSYGGAGFNVIHAPSRQIGASVRYQF